MSRMFKRWRLGSVLGFPVYLNLSFVILLAAAYFWLGGLLGVGVVVATFASVLLHELGHAVVARRRKVPVHAIELSFLGGAAQMSTLPRSASDEVAIAIAGPLVSLALAGLGLGLGSVLDSQLVFTLGAINLVLAIFNLVPALPMDGGRILRALMTRRLDYVRATDTAVGLARAVAVGFAVLGVTYGAYQLVVLAPFLWMMGTRERQLARAVAHRYSYDRRGYREELAPRWAPPVTRSGWAFTAVDPRRSSER